MPPRAAAVTDAGPLGPPVRGSRTGRPIMALLDLAGRRWTLRILWELDRADDPLTFRALRSRCADMSSSVLTRRLGELSDALLVTRPAGAGYALTPLGAELVLQLLPLISWSERWAERLQAERPSS